MNLEQINHRIALYKKRKHIDQDELQALYNTRDSIVAFLAGNAQPIQTEVSRYQYPENPEVVTDFCKGRLD